MKPTKKLFLFIGIILASFQIQAQMSSVTTGKGNELKQNYKTFIIVNESTGWVMAQNPVKYDVSEEMPLCYFTIDNPSNIVMPGSSRLMVIHDLGASQTGDAYDWVLEDNPDEKDIFFARSKFISLATGKWWNVLVEGEEIILQNVATHNFLTIDNTGDYASTDNRKAASRWKLIYVY